MKSINSLSDINVSRILRLIWQKKGISRIEIANTLGIDKSTVTKIVASLHDIGIISEMAEGVTGPQGGRKPIYLEIAPMFACVGGIEINPERFVCCLLDLHGSILFQHQEVIRPDAFHELRIEGVFSKAYKMIAYEAIKLGVKMIGIGVGLPALVNSDEGSIECSVPLMIDGPYPFIENVSRYTDIPISVENDARCCCYGEMMISGDPLVKNMLFLLTEYRILQPMKNSKKNLSIGLGLVMNGRLVKGPECSAGEFRSMLWEEGNKGQFFSGEDSLASVITDNDEMNSIFYELAQHIAFLVNTLNLQLVYIGGIEPQHARQIENYIKERVHIQWPYEKKSIFEVRMASFGSLSVSYGAAAMFIEQLFALPSLSTPSEKGPSILEYLATMSVKKQVSEEKSKNLKNF